MLQSTCILFPIDQTALVSESTCEPVTSEADPGCETGEGIKKDEENISPQTNTSLLRTDPTVQHILPDPTVQCVQPASHLEPNLPVLQVPPDSAINQVQPDSAVEQAQSDSVVNQVQPNCVVKQPLPDSAVEQVLSAADTFRCSMEEGGQSQASQHGVECADSENCSRKAGKT